MQHEINYIGSDDLKTASQVFSSNGGDLEAFIRGWNANMHRHNVVGRFNSGPVGSFERASWLEGWNACDRYYQTRIQNVEYWNLKVA